MSTTSINPVTGNSIIVQKRIQTILVEKSLWLLEGVRLVYETLKCKICQTLSIYDICV